MMEKIKGNAAFAVLMALFFTLAWLTEGCASSQITFIDKHGKPVTVTQELKGRGCISVIVHEDGTLEFVLQQDGSSDWSGLRTIPAMAELGITAIVGNRSDGGPSFMGPSEYRGCAGLFTLESDDS